MRRESIEQRRLAEVVESWLGRGVLVVGDAMLDEWRFAESERLCREAPAPVLTLRRRIAAAGGAANTAVNLSALGGRAALVAPVGADVAGDELHDCLDGAGVWDHTVTQPGWRTPVKRRLLAGDQILLREDEGDSDDTLSPATVHRLLGALTQATGELRAAGDTEPSMVICDYGLGALIGPIRAWLVEHRALFATVALDAHDLADWNDLSPTVVTPSFAEATRLLRAPSAGPGRTPSAGPGRTPSAGSGRTPTVGTDRAPSVGTDRAEVAQAHLAELRARTGADVVAVTLDAEGAVVAGADGEPRRSHTRPVPASYAVGAGDAYLAAMTLALAAQAPLPTAAALAQLAAAATVSQTGTCVCRRSDLLATLGPEEQRQPARNPYAAEAGGTAATAPPEEESGGPRVVDHATLTELVRRRRRQGHRIVFTNGCFDVLHRGHVHYLEQARRLGDLLVVAVNSDRSVRRLKGDDRPVNPVEDRVDVLAALSCVDHVVVFEEDSPATLIETVRPDVYVKGGDYPPEMVPEAPLVRRLGGQVRTLGYVPDRSTSKVIERIRARPHSRRHRAAQDRPPGPFLSGRSA